MADTTLPPSQSDSDQAAPEEHPIASLARAKLRASAFYANKSDSDVNAAKVQPVLDPVSGKRRYETSPITLPRLMGSPLKTKGSIYTVVIGGVPVRRVTSGWGDVRSSDYDDKIDQTRRHGGLDFPAPMGEDVLATADGVVSFVGAQHRTQGGIYIEKAKVDDDGNVFDSSGKLIIPVGELGFGGLFVQITHNGVFQGFKTEYMHLSAISGDMVRGARITEGTKVGAVGVSGGYRGKIHNGVHLHWQVRFDSIIVKPEPLVLHYNPRSPADAPNADILAETMTQLHKKGNLSAGESVIIGAAAGDIRAMNRAVDMENQTYKDHKRRQSEHADYVSQCLSVEAGRLHQVVAQFQSKQPVVTGPMAFDFNTGLWSDGQPV